jgi:hypothetical protein
MKLSSLMKKFFSFLVEYFRKNQNFALCDDDQDIFEILNMKFYFLFNIFHINLYFFELHHL